MLRKILDWINNENDQPASPVSTELAAASLMVEVIAADDLWQDKEESALRQQLSKFLDHAELDQLIEDAKQHHSKANDLYQLTRHINNHFDQTQKNNLIYSLWEIAFADGSLDAYEDHIIRKIAELLYVPHSEFIRGKLRAKPDSRDT